MVSLRRGEKYSFQTVSCREKKRLLLPNQRELHLFQTTGLEPNYDQLEDANFISWLTFFKKEKDKDRTGLSVLIQTMWVGKIFNGPDQGHTVQLPATPTGNLTAKKHFQPSSVYRWLCSNYCVKSLSEGSIRRWRIRAKQIFCTAFHSSNNPLGPNWAV